MGSTGTGNFSDYPTGSGNPTQPTTGGGGGGVDPNDRCLTAFSVQLEDVEHSAYFQMTSILPPIGTKLKLAHQKRIVAVDLNGAVVGNLPTKYNYLADCMAKGQDYIGQVVTSVSGHTATVIVDFAPIP